MATEIDQQFIDYIVKSLVSNPDSVSVERTIDQKGVLLTLTVHPDDLGRVIGRRGTTAQSLRTLLRALGTKNDARYNLKIVDTDNVGEESARAADTSASTDEEEPAGKTGDEPEDTASSSKENNTQLSKKTRKDLADLDDLDV